MKNFSVKNGIMAAIVASLGLLLLVACGNGDDDSESSTSQPAAAPTAAPESAAVSPTAAPATSDPVMAEPVEPKVKRVIMAVTPPSSEFSAPRMGGQPQAFQVRPIYEYLIGIDAETGGFVPELATEWNLEPDGLSFRFKLREGVKWQRDFGEFTAEDVLFTHEQFILEDSVHGQTTNASSSLA